jgi:hypothetical protein
MFEKFYRKLEAVNSPEVLSIEPFKLDRKLERVSRVNQSILGYGHKVKCMNYLESKLEMDTFLAMEFDPKVEAYLTQPASFYIVVDGKKVRHTPDGLLIFDGGEMAFVQVKPAQTAYSPEYQRKFKQYQRFFSTQLGFPYILFTEQDLGESKAVVNLQQLFHFLDVKVSSIAKNRILKNMPPQFSVFDLEQTCKDHGRDDFFAWALIAHGHIAYDNSKLLTRSSLVSVAA